MSEVVAFRIATEVCILPFFAGFSIPDEDTRASILRSVESAAIVGKTEWGSNADSHRERCRAILLQLARKQVRITGARLCDTWLNECERFEAWRDRRA